MHAHVQIWRNWFNVKFDDFKFDNFKFDDLKLSTELSQLFQYLK